MKRVPLPPRPGPQTILWPHPPDQFSLSPDIVHVWAVDLGVLAGQTEDQAAVLSAEERQRGAKFRFAIDRQRFVARRWALRVLLSGYVGLPPQGLIFEQNQYGKPKLAKDKDISFSLSHSAGLVLLAFACGRQVGVDVERLRQDFDYQGVSGRFFSRQEQVMLQALPEAQRRRAFFLCWTRKEAFIKALGQGLSLPLDQFDVSLTPGEPAELLSTRAEPAGAGRWRLQHLQPSPDYPAALAVEGFDWDLCCWQMPARRFC